MSNTDIPNFSGTFVHDNAVCASDLGLKPGEWPDALTISGELFRRATRIVSGDGFEGFVYTTRYRQIEILND